MELTNTFRVAVGVEDAWRVLTDVERIAPCLPGAQLQEVDGDTYTGTVKVKVGPITAQYKGTASFIEKDDSGHRAVLKAEGRDTRGQGNASATVTATLVPDDGGTSVTVVTDLTVTGKVAQFGRGVLADVSGKLLTQFVQCLESDVLGQTEAEVVVEDETRVAEAGPRLVEQREVEAVDLFDAAGAPLAKRVAPVFGLALVVALWLVRRARRKG